MAQEAEDLPESSTYDPTFSGSALPGDHIRSMQAQSLADKGFIKPTAVQVAVVHQPYMEEDQFGIQMSVPDMISGCYALTPLEYEAKFTEPQSLDIKVKRYRRVAPEGSNAQKKCDAQNKMSTALMVLSRKDLKERGTKEIRFSTDAGNDTYKIVLDDTHLELIPRSMMVFKAQTLSGPLKDRIVHTFAGNKVVTLQVPMAQSGEDLSEEIASFAITRGLSPADGGQKPSWNDNGRASYYYVDQTGLLTSQLTPDSTYAQIGTIEVNRPYDGPEGRSETLVPLTVFVTRPGTQL